MYESVLDINKLFITIYMIMPNNIRKLRILDTTLVIEWVLSTFEETRYSYDTSKLYSELDDSSRSMRSLFNSHYSMNSWDSRCVHVRIIHSVTNSRLILILYKYWYIFYILQYRIIHVKCYKLLSEALFNLTYFQR